MKKFGLIGESLKHSFSQQFFTNYFEKNQIEATYENLEFSNKEELSVFFQSAIKDYSGLNVTIPYKETVLPFLTELTPEAKAIGAINTIKINGDQLIGHNTDCFGFHQMIKPFLNNQHQKVMILGTGGASKAVEYVFKTIGIDCIFISQNKKGDAIFNYSDINNYMVDACKCIVNTTPVGMFPHENEQIPFPYEYLTNQHLVIDLIYNPKETLFLKAAKEKDCIILNGETMLREQALAAYTFWN